MQQREERDTIIEETRNEQKNILIDIVTYRVASQLKMAPDLKGLNTL